MPSLLLYALLLGPPAPPATSAGAPEWIAPAPHSGSQRGGQRGASQEGGGQVGGLDAIKRGLKKRNPPKNRDPRGVAKRTQKTGRNQQTGEEGERRRPRRADRVSEEQLAGWYVTVDDNRNGWISFSEARASLHFDRPRFQAYDADRDGRMQLEEFEDYYLESLTRDGSFRAPTAVRSNALPARRNHEQIRIAYDFDLDGQLSLPEVIRVLADYDQAALDPQRVVRALDADGDQLLDLAELQGLPSILYPVTLPSVDEPSQEQRTPTTIAELFGQRVDRSTNPRASAAPPRIVGPLPHFQRLDLDQDGGVSVAELEALIRPTHLAVRIRTIVNTLDQDLDGVLSEAEFLGALLAPARRAPAGRDQ